MLNRSWNPHGDYAKELAFFVDFVGLRPLDVIKCATQTGAGILGREEELGTLAAGKLADVLVVDGDVVLTFQSCRIATNRSP